jgi:hypothetical protein
MPFGGLAITGRLGGAKPTAAWWVQARQAAFGNAFSQDLTSNVGIQHIAVARQLAAVTYTQEKLVNNSTPVAAYDSLLDWAKRLGISVTPTSTEDDIRNACVAQYQATNGNNPIAVEQSVSTLLGSVYVQVIRFYGSDPGLMSHEAIGTYWDAGSLPSTYPHIFDFGGDTFVSPSSYLLIQVTQPSGMTDNDFLYLLNVRLYQLLSNLLPAWTTFAWCTSIGFILDSSHLDRVALT